MVFDFIVDNKNKQLKRFFKKNTKLKEIHIDTYSGNPLIVPSTTFVLLSRAIENNAIVLSNEHRIILKRNDRYNTYLVNIPFSKIEECYWKEFDGVSEFILNIQNSYLKIAILN
jgi:hypothetical protein